MYYNYMHKELKDSMYQVLLYCLLISLSFFLIFIQEHDITWMYTEFWQRSGVYWHSFFFFLMETILFLYSLANQHSPDQPFHMMCYRSSLQLPQFAANIVWINTKQHDICDVSLHFAPQVTFNSLSML